MPDVDCHVIEASVVFGQPVSIDGERKVFADLFDYLDRLVGSNPLFGLSTFANRDVVHALPIAQEIKRRYNAPIPLWVRRKHLRAARGSRIRRPL